MIRNLVFDIGGVLLDYQPIKTCLRLADSPEDAQEIYRTLFQTPEWAQKLDQGLITEDEMLALCQSRLATQRQKEAAARIFQEYHDDALTPMPGMESIVKSLHRRGFRIYLLSNTGIRIHRVLHKLPGIKVIDGFLFSYQEKLMKPDLHIYSRLLEKFSLQAKECLFVDDIQTNVDGAIAAGLQGYCFQDGDVERLQAFLGKLLSPNSVS